MGEIIENRLQELKISVFGTTVFSIVVLLLYKGSVSLLAVIMFNTISIISLVISITADRINRKYNMYIAKKEGEVIDNTFNEEFARHSHKEMWIVPKNAEYYKRVGPVKFLFTILSILAVPFYLWHESTQVFESLYKRIFR